MCPGPCCALQRCAAIRGDYASTEPPSAVLQAVLVLPDCLGHLDGAGGTAGYLPATAHWANSRSGTESFLANASPSLITGATFWTPLGFALVCSRTPAQCLVGRDIRADHLDRTEGPLRLSRYLSGELCRLRHGHRHAQ